MLLDMLAGGFGNSINIWFFYRILHFSPFQLLTKRHKKLRSSKQNIAKSTNCENNDAQKKIMIYSTYLAACQQLDDPRCLALFYQ